MMKDLFRTLRLLLVGVVATAGLVGCGLLVDSTPASISLFTPTGEVPDGHQLVGIRAVDPESGIKRVLLERRESESERWSVVTDVSFTADDAGSPPVTETPAGGAAQTANAAEGSELRRSREVVGQVPLGEHELRVTVLNGSNIEAVVEQTWGEPLVFKPVTVEALPVPELIPGTNKVKAETFSVRFLVSGDYVETAELWVSINGADASRLLSVAIPDEVDVGEFSVNGSLFSVGDQLEFSVRVKSLDGLEASTGVAFLPVVVVAPRDDQVDPDVPPVRLNMNVKPAGTVTRNEDITVSYSATGGVGGIESVNLFVTVNDEDEKWLELNYGGPSPFTGEFSVAATDFAVGDELVFRVEAQDAQDQEASASGGIRVVAPEEAVADPLEVLVTGVTVVNGAGELLSDVSEFEIRFIAESGVEIDRVDLMYARSGAGMQLLQRQTPGGVNVTGAFIVDSTAFEAGETYEFEIVARDVNGRTAKTDSISVSVVAPPPVAIEPLEVSIGVTPATVVHEDPLLIPYGVTSGAEITEVALWVGVNGLAPTRQNVTSGGASPVVGNFTLGTEQFAVGDELSLEVRAKDAEGREDSSSAAVEVVAASVVVDPLVVTVTEVTGVNSSNELLSTTTEFQLSYLVRSGAVVTRVDLQRSRNGQAFQLVDTVAPGGLSTSGQFRINSSNFEVGEVYEYRLDAVDDAGQAASSDVVVVEVVAPPPVVIDPLEVNVGLMPSSVERGDELSVPYGITSGATITEVALWVSVNGAAFIRDQVNTGGTSPVAGEFLLGTNQFVAGDELTLEVRVKDAEGREDSASVDVDVVAPPVVLPDPPEVLITSVTVVNSAGELLTDVAQFEIRFVAESGVEIDRIDLMYSLNGSARQLMQRQTLESKNVSSNFVVDSSGFAAGDEYEFEIVARDLDGRTASSSIVSVLVVSPPPVVFDPLEVSIGVMPSSVDHGGELAVPFVVTSGVEITEVSLWIGVNGAVPSRRQVVPGGMSFVSDEFTIDTTQFEAGDELALEVRAKDAEARVDADAVSVEVVTPPVVAPDPIEVIITSVTQVNSAGELLSEVAEFEVAFVAESGVIIDRIDLMYSRDGGPMQLLQRQTPSGLNVTGSFVIDSRGYEAGSEYEFEITARDVEKRMATTDSFTVLIVSPPPVVVDPLEVSIGVTPASVIREHELVVPFDITSGAAITEVALWIGVNGNAVARQQVSSGGVSPMTGSFTVDTTQFAAGDELLVEVRAKDAEGREDSATVDVEVVAAPVVIPDPLEVSITNLIGVSSSNELLSTATEFQVAYLARSGVNITRVDLLRSRNGGPFQMLDSVNPDLLNANGQFLVNASNYEAGETYEFRIDAADEAGRTSSSDVVTVNVVAPPPVVLDPVEAFILRVDPSNSAGEIERGQWTVHYASNTDDTLSIRHVSLFVTVNGGTERMIERVAPASGTFMLDGMAYSVGDELSLVIEAEDDRGASAATRSEPLVITVVAVPEPTPEVPTANAVILEPVVTGGSIDREDVLVRVNAAGGANLTLARLMLSVNGAAATEVGSETMNGTTDSRLLTAHRNLFDEGDTLALSVVVTDELGRTATSNTMSVTVNTTPVIPEDDTPPLGESIVIRTSDPSNKFIDQSGIIIEYAASDDVNLARVRILESVNGGTPTLVPFGSIEVAGTYAEGTFEVSTSHYSKGDVVVYTLETVDAAGNTDALSSKSYEVVEFVESSGYLVSALPDSLELSDDLVLNIALYDDGSTGVSSFDLYLNGALTPFVVSTDGRVHSYAWDVSVLSPGIHTIAIVVKFEAEEHTPVLIMHTLTLEAESEEEEPVGP